MSLTSSLGEFLGYCMDWLWYPGLPPVFVFIAFPFAFHILVFFYSLFFTCHWISFVFLLYGRRICTHSVDPSLIHFLHVREFPGSGTRCCGSRGETEGAHGAEISIQIIFGSIIFPIIFSIILYSLAGVEPRTLASRGRELYY